MSDEFSFKFNKKTEQNIQNYQGHIDFNLNLIDRFKNIISIFDTNKNHTLDNSEIKEIWKLVSGNSKIPKPLIY